LYTEIPFLEFNGQSTARMQSSTVYRKWTPWFCERGLILRSWILLPSAAEIFLRTMNGYGTSENLLSKLTTTTDPCCQNIHQAFNFPIIYFVNCIRLVDTSVSKGI